MRDEELMLQYAAGDVGAFEELFRRYGQKIYNIFLRSSGDSALAQDLLQECFLRVSEARYRYKPKAPFSNWLITLAMNLLRDNFRKKRRREAHFLPIAERGKPDFLPGPATDPQISAEQQQVKAAVDEALRHLPEEQREVIILSKFEGLSFAEIGNILGISPAAAKQKAYRGIQTLREKLSYLNEG